MTRRLAQTLLATEVIAQADIEEALQRQVLFGGSLGTNLLEAGVLTEEQLIKALGEAYELPTANKADVDAISPHIPRLFPQVFAESYHLVPYRLEADTLSVLVTGQPDRQLIDRIRQRLALSVSPYITSEIRLHYAMNQLYSAELLPRYKTLLSKIDGSTVVSEPAAARPATMLSWGVSSAHVALPAEKQPESVNLRDVLARLEFATDRDTIVELLMRAVRAIFDFVALFQVQGETLHGWRATDPAATQRVAQISLGVELPSVFQTIYATRGHYLGPLPQNSVNGRLLEQLGRERPRAAFVAPLIIGNKLAMMLYADNGARGIAPRRVAAALLLTQRASVAFERVIRKRKAAAKRIGDESPQAQEWEEDIPIEFDLAEESAQEEPTTEVGAGDFEVVADSPVGRAAPVEVNNETSDPWDSVSFSGVDESPDASRAAFERGISESASDDAVAEDYVAFSDVEDTAEENLDGWGDVLVETADALDIQAAPPAPKATARQVPPSVTWDDVIKEALSAAKHVATPAPASVEVAGTVVNEAELLVDGAEAQNPNVRRDAIERLINLGEAAHGAVAARFPGILSFDPFDPRSRVPPFAKCSGITEYLFACGTSAAPLVLPFLSDADRVKRFVAIYYLLAVRYPQALDALARSLYDAEPRNRHLAADALRTYANEAGYQRIVEAVRAQLNVPVPDSQVSAVQILGQLRDPASVPELIRQVLSPNAALAKASISALAVICAQNFNNDVPAWSEWWRNNYNRPRPVWLIQGLRHSQPQVRRIANYELQLMTGMTTHFDPEAPDAEREEKTRMWENWWLHFSRQQEQAGPEATAS